LDRESDFEVMNHEHSFWIQNSIINKIEPSESSIQTSLIKGKSAMATKEKKHCIKKETSPKGSLSHKTDTIINSTIF
jgi:hypothetical protein